MDLAIVIPAFNEEKRIIRSIQRIKAFVSLKKWACKLVIVDDGSTDGTAEVVRRELDGIPAIPYRLLRNDRNRGKGYSVRRGMLEADSDLILFTDADLSTPIEEVEKLMAAVKSGYDVAIGSRGLGSSQVEVHQNFLRETMGKVFNRIARLLVFKGIKDSQCGFKVFRGEAARRLFSLQRLDGFAFDVEVIYLAQKLGFKIKEVPVVWRNSKASKVHILWDSLDMFCDLFRIRWCHRHDEKNADENNP